MQWDFVTSVYGTNHDGSGQWLGTIQWAVRTEFVDYFGPFNEYRFLAHVNARGSNDPPANFRDAVMQHKAAFPTDNPIPIMP